MGDDWIWHQHPRHRILPLRAEGAAPPGRRLPGFVTAALAFAAVSMAEPVPLFDVCRMTPGLARGPVRPVAAVGYAHARPCRRRTGLGRPASVRRRLPGHGLPPVRGRLRPVLRPCGLPGRNGPCDPACRRLAPFSRAPGASADASCPSAPPWPRISCTRRAPARPRPCRDARAMPEPVPPSGPAGPRIPRIVS